MTPEIKEIRFSVIPQDDVIIFFRDGKFFGIFGLTDEEIKNNGDAIQAVIPLAKCLCSFYDVNFNNDLTVGVEINPTTGGFDNVSLGVFSSKKKEKKKVKND